MTPALPIAIVDSNVVVAGLLNSRPDAPTAELLDGMLSGRVRFALSMTLLAEYHRVMRYSKVARLHGLKDREIDDLLTRLATPAIVREPAPMQTPLSDPDDEFLFELLATFDHAVLVTGDNAVIREAPDWASVVSPGEFVAMLARSPGI